MKLYYVNDIWMEPLVGSKYRIYIKDGSKLRIRVDSTGGQSYYPYPAQRRHFHRLIQLIFEKQLSFEADT